MAIVFMGAELENFTVTGSWTHTVSYAETVQRTGYARAMMTRSNTDSSNNLLGTFSAAKTTVGLTARRGVYSWTDSTGYCFFGATNAGTFVLGLQSTASTGYVKLVKYNGSGYTTLATGAKPSGASPVRIDMYIESYADTVNGRCRVWLTYIDGAAPATLWLDYTGDLTSPGVSDLTGVMNAGISVSSYALAAEGICEVVACDEPPHRIQLVTCAPNAAGDTNDWTGAYTDVDEINASTGDYIESDAAAEVFLCNIGPLPTSVMVPLAVQVTALAAKGTSGPTKLDLGVKSGGTQNWGSDQTLTDVYVPYGRLMTVNPVTATAWDKSEIPDLQIGVKSVT